MGSYKHEIGHHFRPVMAGTHCLGHLLYTARGWSALDREDKLIGTFPDLDAAARKLQTLAAAHDLTWPAMTQKPAQDSLSGLAFQQRRTSEARRAFHVHVLQSEAPHTQRVQRRL